MEQDLKRVKKNISITALHLMEINDRICVTNKFNPSTHTETQSVTNHEVWVLTHTLFQNYPLFYAIGILIIFTPYPNKNYPIFYWVWMFTLLPTPPLNGKINYPLFFQGELESKLKKKNQVKKVFYNESAGCTMYLTTYMITYSTLSRLKCGIWHIMARLLYLFSMGNDHSAAPSIFASLHRARSACCSHRAMELDS